MPNEEKVRELKLPEDPAREMLPALIHGDVKAEVINRVITCAHDLGIATVELASTACVQVPSKVFEDGSPKRGDWLVSFPSGRIVWLDGDEGSLFVRFFGFVQAEKPRDWLGGDGGKIRHRVRLFSEKPEFTREIDIPGFDEMPRVIAYEGRTYALDLMVSGTNCFMCYVRTPIYVV